MNKLVCKITQEDIEGATRNSVTNCPVARAVRRTIGKPVFVLWQRVYKLNEDGSRHILYTLPAYVTAQIHRYDDGGAFVLKKMILEDYQSEYVEPIHN